MERLPGIAICLAAVLLGGCASAYAPTFGVREGQLAPCPQSRACVSSQATDPERHVQPLTYSTDREQARKDLVRAIQHFHGARIVSSHRHYLRAEFPSAAGRDRDSSEYYYESEAAIDDVEFYMVPGRKEIEVRSVSRLGLVDMGENRRRVETLRKLLTQLQATHRQGG